MASDQGSSDSPRRVAIVDDEEDITTFLRLALEDAGFVVATSNIADQAHALLRAFRPDLICLDLLMPGRTGASLYLEMREDPELAAVPVLILSGLDAREELAALLAREANVPPPAGYVEKPVAAEGFVHAVRALLPPPLDPTAGTMPDGSGNRGGLRGGS